MGSRLGCDVEQEMMMERVLQRKNNMCDTVLAMEAQSSKGLHWHGRRCGSLSFER